MLPPYDKIETRTWSTKYRGLVLIHVGLQPYRAGQIVGISGENNYHRISLINQHEWQVWKSQMGKAIAIGELVDCRPMQKDDEYQTFVKYFPDLYCWVFNNVQPIVPFKMKGQQGLWTVSDEIKSKITLLQQAA